MEILMDYETIYSNHCYTFKLSDYKNTNDKIPIGVQILFSLYSHKDFNFYSMSAEGDGDIGEPKNILGVERSEAAKYFCNAETLADVFFKKELIDWDMIGEYQGVIITILGDCNGTIVDLNYPSDSDIDVVSMMQEIEKSSIL